jgi:Family of unknown function (DUF6427)
MITSVFKKSSPINYTVVTLLVVALFIISQIKQGNWLTSSLNGITSVGIFILLFGSLFLTNFIVKKNGLTKNSSYSILFFALFLMFFPSVLTNFKLLFANFFILLAMRRLVSLQTLKAPKEKIFDASLWIFVASLFHFWAILFIVLVYISIIYHVSRDYRNWLIPFVSLFATLVVYLIIALASNIDFMGNLSTFTMVDFKMDYFINKYQNLALSMFTVVGIYFLFTKVISLTNRPLVLQASYKKIIFTFLIGIVIFIISPNKTNDLLLFTFFPLAVMATNAIEYSKNKPYQEMVLALSIVLVFLSFFLQL